MRFNVPTLLRKAGDNKQLSIGVCESKVKVLSMDDNNNNDVDYNDTGAMTIVPRIFMFW